MERRRAACAVCACVRGWVGAGGRAVGAGCIDLAGARARATARGERARQPPPRSPQPAAAEHADRSHPSIHFRRNVTFTASTREQPQTVTQTGIALVLHHPKTV